MRSSILRTLALAPVLAAAGGCGALKAPYKVKATLDNRSDYPAKLRVGLDDTAYADNCSNGGDVYKEAEVAPHSKRTLEATMQCDYEPYYEISYTLERPTDPQKPTVHEYAVHFGDFVETPLQAGESIYWLDGAGEVGTAAISTEPYFENGRVKGLPDTQALLAQPVRTNGAVLQLFVRSDVKIQALGIVSSRYKPRADYAPRDTFVKGDVTFAKTRAYPVTGNLSGNPEGKSAKISCTNEGCAVK